MKEIPSEKCGDAGSEGNPVRRSPGGRCDPHGYQRRKTGSREDTKSMIPKDPFMLLSYINTQLRDFYPDLDQMCQALGLEKKELEDKLAGIDYSYDKTTNQFV